MYLLIITPISSYQYVLFSYIVNLNLLLCWLFSTGLGLPLLLLLLVFVFVLWSWRLTQTRTFCSNEFEGWERLFWNNSLGEGIRPDYIYCYRRLAIPCNKNEYEELLLLNQWLSRASVCSVCRQWYSTLHTLLARTIMESLSSNTKIYHQQYSILLLTSAAAVKRLLSTPEPSPGSPSNDTLTLWTQRGCELPWEMVLMCRSENWFSLVKMHERSLSGLRST